MAQMVARLDDELAAEVDLLIGDPTKAHAKLGWDPNVTFEAMIQMMVEADMKRLKENPERIF